MLYLFQADILSVWHVLYAVGGFVVAAILAVWRLSRYYTKKELEVIEEKRKLDETHEVALNLQKVLEGFVDEMHKSNEIAERGMNELTKMREDFHEHTLEDKHVQGKISEDIALILGNQRAIMRKAASEE